jgi:hypothetical protein
VILGFVIAINAVAATVGKTADEQPDQLTVVLDQAELLKLPERVSTVVVGNPMIADVSIQSGRTMVVTGKGYGSTNIIALDRGGAILMEKSVQVTGPRENVVFVYRGIDRESYSCAPKCERRITLGDVPAFFDATIKQTDSRDKTAASGGNGSSQR